MFRDTNSIDKRDAEPVTLKKGDRITFHRGNGTVSAGDENGVRLLWGDRADKWIFPVGDAMDAQMVASILAVSVNCNIKLTREDRDHFTFELY